MGWNGSGGYNRQENFSADSSAGIKILATRMDTEFDDVASAITLALARDGQNVPTANLRMAGFRFTNVGAAASAEDYVRAKEIIRDVPVYSKESTANLTTAVRVSVPYFVSVSAGQSPPDGTRLRVQAQGTKTSISCDMYLFTPLNTSAGLMPHIAPIWSRARKFDPQAIRNGEVYEFVYDASASGWHCLNPSRSFVSLQAKVKAKDNNGIVAGVASASTNVNYTRSYSQLVFSTQTSVSVSCSISAKYLILSANGATSMTSGAASNMCIPITVKDAPSTFWGAQILQGQIYITALFNVAGTTVSAACTIRAAPFTAVLLAQ